VTSGDRPNSSLPVRGRDDRPRFPWVLTAASLLSLAVLLSLGFWQLQRLEWKQDLIHRSEAAAGLPEVPLGALGEMTAPEFRSAILACDFGNRRFVELQSILDGEPGVRLISECDGWLVDLGFVPQTISDRSAMKTPSRTGIIAQARRVEAPGVFAPAPEGNRFYARDTGAMSRALGMERGARPYVLFATTSVWPDWQALEPSAPPAAFSNNHLGYALTWFGLALALIGFYIALMRRKLTS
jgi:surfeit locus 1 family protein